MIHSEHNDQVGNQHNIVSNTVFIFVTMHAWYYNLSNMKNQSCSTHEKEEKTNKQYQKKLSRQKIIYEISSFSLPYEDDCEVNRKSRYVNFFATVRFTDPFKLDLKTSN